MKRKKTKEEKDAKNAISPELVTQTWIGYATERSREPHKPSYLSLHKDGTFELFEKKDQHKSSPIQIHQKGRWEHKEMQIFLHFNEGNDKGQGFLKRLDSEWLSLSFYGETFYLCLTDPKKDFFKDRKEQTLTASSIREDS